MTDTRITDFEAVAPMPIYTQADLDAAVEKEREACAMIAASFIDEEWPGDDLSTQAENIASSIRAGGRDD
jgi:hypothetical protein